MRIINVGIEVSDVAYDKLKPIICKMRNLMNEIEDCAVTEDRYGKQIEEEELQSLLKEKDDAKKQYDEYWSENCFAGTYVNFPNRYLISITPYKSTT